MSFILVCRTGDFR